MYHKQHRTSVRDLTKADLSVEPDSEDVVGVAVVADLRTLLEVVDVHASRHGHADHHHQAAGEQTLHDGDIWAVCWEKPPHPAKWPQRNTHHQTKDNTVWVECLRCSLETQQEVLLLPRRRYDGGAGGAAALPRFTGWGTAVGYKLYSLTSVEKLDCIHDSAPGGVVSMAMPRRMNVYHFKKGTEICNYSYSHDILAVRLNRQTCGVPRRTIYIHNIKDMKLLKTLLKHRLTRLCALSVNHSNSYLAHPGSATIGEIVVYDANNLSTVTMIPAHDSPLAALAFNALGTKLASASRGYVNISSLSFSPDGQFLCTSSNTETVHIFKLEQLGITGEEVSPTWTAYVGKMFSAASSYLPTQVSGMMSQDRAFATAHLLPRAKLPRLLVVSADGQLLIYNVDPQDGENYLAVMRNSGQEVESEGSNLNVPAQACPSYAATAALPRCLLLQHSQVTVGLSSIQKPCGKKLSIYSVNDCLTRSIYQNYFSLAFLFLLIKFMKSN
ncbi:WD repeat domain phosphoinositide-interacting protein 1 [Merluccius polli]|uniref:WD repeat domain phosphoinositide-interacting protein 1 n=1 Tax=Merluccius polli TaxID=89951 RepID=A0AA47P202_MERPO|nr:WD repeat domain phosphoinositide-interacting protein 1 [Merluccius polli]